MLCLLEIWDDAEALSPGLTQHGAGPEVGVWLVKGLPPCTYLGDPWSADALTLAVLRACRSLGFDSGSARQWGGATAPRLFLFP